MQRKQNRPQEREREDAAGKSVKPQKRPLRLTWLELDGTVEGTRAREDWFTFAPHSSAQYGALPTPREGLTIPPGELIGHGTGSRQEPRSRTKWQVKHAMDGTRLIVLRCPPLLPPPPPHCHPATRPLRRPRQTLSFAAGSLRGSPCRESPRPPWARGRTR